MKYLLLSLFAFFIIVNQAVAVNDPQYPYHPNQNISFTTSNLPIVVIKLNEVMASKEEDRRIDAIMTVINRTDGTRNSITDTASANWNNPNIINYHGHISIKYRGNSSFGSSPKKPFSLKTQDNSGSNIDVNIMDIGADKDWDLLAPYNDRSLIRDMLIFDLMRPYLDYTPDGKFCELILNGVYQGIYIMTAKVDRGDNRIDLPKPGTSGNNLTGGYHLEMDRNDEPVFWSNYHTRDLYGNNLNQNTCYQYKYPEYEDYMSSMQTQKTYIENRVHQFENTVAGSDFKDPVRGYRKDVDVVSIIDFMLAQEFTHNVDGYRLSSPFYKYRDNVDTRFKFTIWDFNISMGNADYYEGWSTEGWQWNMNGVPSALGDGNLIPFFFKRILEDEVFRMEMRERWNYFRQTNFSNQSIQNKIDSLQILLNEASSRNFSVWNYNWGSTVWPNYYASANWTDELNYLKNWINKRIVWMDSQLLTNMPNNLIRNGNFDSDMFRGASSTNIIFSCWQTSGTVGLSETTPLNGRYTLSFRNKNASAKQTLTELDKGKYTLKVWVRTVENPEGKIVISPMGNNIPINYTIANNSLWHEISISNIEVLSGVCDVKFETGDVNFGGNTRLYVDSVSFFPQMDQSYTYHPDTKLDLPSSNLPIMLFNVPNSFVTNGNTQTQMSLINRLNGGRNRITDLNAINILDSTVISYHGNIRLELIPSSDNKKSFILYTQDIDGNNVDVNLLGLGLAHQWILNASINDPSFVRGMLAGRMTDSISVKRNGEALELMINNVYQGLYIIVPQQDIDQTLGMELPQGSNTNENTFVLALNQGSDFISSIPNLKPLGESINDYAHYSHVFPKSADRTPQMESMTQQYFQSFESNVWADYQNYIDTTSFFKYILYMELFRNVNAYRSASLISKKTNGKLQLYTTDFQSLFSNIALYDVWSPEGWAWNFNRFETTPTLPFWFTVLLNNSDFMQGLSRYWRQLRNSNFSDASISALVTSLQQQLTEAHDRDNRIWRYLSNNENYYQGLTWEDEMAVIKQFLLHRAAWMDGQLLTSHQTNLVANGNFDADFPRNSGEDILLSSWNSNKYTLLPNIIEEQGFSCLFKHDVEQIISPITEGYYNLTFNYIASQTPLIVSIIAPSLSDTIVLTDTLNATEEWQTVDYVLLPLPRNGCKLYFSTINAIPEAFGKIDNVSLIFTKGIGIEGNIHLNYKNCKVYPNPFTQRIGFEYTAQSENSIIRIYSMTGLQMAQFVSSGTIGVRRRVQWDAASLPVGIYFYQIQDGIYQYSGKIIKQ
jgi:hypothetical protein